MFEYYGHVYVYSPEKSADNPPWAQNIFININLPSICSFLARFLPSNEIFLFFPFKCMGDLSWPCHKIGQGHPRVMTYTNFVELHPHMFHNKFRNHRPSGSEEKDF